MSLEDFIAKLLVEDKSMYDQLIRSVSFSKSTFEKYMSWSDDCYTRNCIVDNDQFELILICWCKGHRTAIHDHGGEECWVKVIEGAFKEVIYVKGDDGKLVSKSSSVAMPNEVTYMKDFMGFHSLENVANCNSISLHLYAKPIRSCQVFDQKSGCFFRKDLAYSTTSDN